MFQVMFVFQQAQVLDGEGLTPFVLRESGPRMDLGGLEIDSLALDLGTAQFDLTLVAAQQRDHLALSLEYNVDLFDAATIERLLGHFQTLLESIVAAPDLPIDSLTILPSAERGLLLSTWGTHPADPPPAETILQLFDVQVRQKPRASAVVFSDQEMTYAELDERAHGLAQRLRKLGVRPETRVGLAVPRSLEMIVGIWGILKAGGAYVPIDPDYPAERLEFLLADAGIEILLTGSSSAETSRTCRNASFSTSMPSTALVSTATEPTKGASAIQPRPQAAIAWPM